MKLNRPLHTLFLSCLAVVFWSMNVSSTAAFFYDREASLENYWQGAVVNLILDAPAPLTTPDNFSVAKHAFSLDLYYQLSVVASSSDTCSGVTLELVGPPGTTTASVADFPTVATTELGDWQLHAERTTDTAVAECELTIQVKAWSKDTPEQGFSDTKDIFVVVPAQVETLLLSSPLTGGTEKSFKTAASDEAPKTPSPETLPKEGDGDEGTTTNGAKSDDSSDEESTDPTETLEDEVKVEEDKKETSEETTGEEKLVTNEESTGSDTDEDTDSEPAEERATAKKSEEESFNSTVKDEESDSSSDVDEAPEAKPEEESDEEPAATAGSDEDQYDDQGAESADGDEDADEATPPPAKQSDDELVIESENDTTD